MDNEKRTTRRGLAAVAVLILFASMLFAYTVQLRSPWFGASPVCPEIWLTSAPLLLAKNWYYEGPLTFRFAQILDPASIEFPTMASREVYSSYPPGAVLPIYLLGKLTGRPPSLEMVMVYGLFNQLAITVLLALMVFLFVRQCGGGLLDAFLLACIPIVLHLLLPAPAFLYQMAYLSDTAVLLPFVLYVTLEFCRDATGNARLRLAISCAQGVLAFFGILTDWLFAFAGLCLYVKRFAMGAIWPFRDRPWSKAIVAFIRNSLQFGFPFLLAMGMFLMQVYHFNRFPALAEKFRERTGMTSGSFLPFSANNYFWQHHMPRGYGVWGDRLVFGSAILFLVLLACAMVRFLRRQPPNVPLNRGLSLTFLLLAPGLFETFALWQHSSHVFHFFSTAKFAIPLAVLPFVVLPLTALAAANLSFSIFSVTRLRAWSLLTLPLVIVAGSYAGSQFQHMRELFVQLPKSDLMRVGAFIAGNTGYEDVVFTSNPALVTEGTPVLLAHARKHVYRADSLRAIRDKVGSISGEYVVDYLVMKSNLTGLSTDMQPLLKAAYTCRSEGDLSLYKIRKGDFSGLCNALRAGL